MSGRFPVICSVLDPTALAVEVGRRYPVGPVDGCELLTRNLTDTYTVRAGGRQYALRVYHSGFRSAADVGYELDLVRHAAARGVGVALPIADRDGGWSWVVDAPEGPRQVAMFTWAPGEERSAGPYPSEAYGRAVGALHDALDGFSSPHQRAALDGEHLLARPLRAAEPYLADQPAELDYFRSVVAGLRDRLDRVADGLSWGPCHGDLHGGNALVAPDGGLTFIDFDDCGPGWRAFELAVFRWSCSINPRGGKSWDDYLRGYRSVHAFAAADLAAVPLFVGIRTVSWLGMMASHAGHWGGRSMLDRAFWLRHLAIVADWLAEQPDAAPRTPVTWACPHPRP
jgi:Ser/Thr protein kinase RdoA (MazF antagonist)